MTNLLYRIYKIKLSTALIILMPFIAVIISYSYSTYIDFLNIKHAVSIGDEPIETTLTSDRFKTLLRNRLKQEVIRFSTPEIADNSPLESYRIYVKPQDLATLNSNLPKSGKNYIPGYLLASSDSSIKKIKMRYRGGIPTHWLYKQKSMRIKLEKGSLNNMERTFNLINPPHDYFIIDYISYDISREAGLITPDSKPVNVYLNNEHMGLYSYTSQVDESTLRKSKRMPGSVYYGEGGRPDNDGVSSLWFKETNWGKKSSRNAEQKDNRDDIKQFISGINQESAIEFYKFVNTYLNKEKFYTFFAIDTIVGAYHHDYAHNHKIYFDPYLGKFEPIQWDVRFWTQSTIKDVATYPLLFNTALNPILEMERDQKAYELLHQFNPKNIETRLLHYIELIYNDLEADAYKDHGKSDQLFNSFYSLSFNMNDFIENSWENFFMLVNRNAHLKKTYQHSDISYKIDYLSENIVKIHFKANGNSPANIDLKQLFPDTAFQIYLDKNKNNIPEENELSKETLFTLYPGRKIIEGNALKAQKISLFGIKHLEQAPLYYPFLIKTKHRINKPDIIANNAITNEEFLLTQEAFTEEDNSDSIHPWELPLIPARETITLQGDIFIENDLVFNKEKSVIIAPGTTFHLAANTSIIFYGQVKAIGTKTSPIRFIAKEENNPWGSIIIQGQAASNSSLSFIEVSNGSTTVHNLIHYTAQLNIHDTSNFTLENCIIGKNHIGDDSTHIAYSSGSVNNCLFYNARSDALDIDISDITISNSLFVNSGNDALDLMTSQAVIKNNLFLNSDDKGISIGEWSKTSLSDNVFYKCNIGVEIKDKSSVTAENLIFINSKKHAINLYNKNIRYDYGGTLTGNNLIFINDDKDIKENIINIQKDQKSDYTLYKTHYNYPGNKISPYILKQSGNIKQWSNLASVLNRISTQYNEQ